MSSVRATLSEVFADDAYWDDREVGGGYIVDCHFGDSQFTFCCVTGFWCGRVREGGVSKSAGNGRQEEGSRVVEVVPLPPPPLCPEYLFGHV